jgi:hypothetical protein
MADRGMASRVDSGTITLTIKRPRNVPIVACHSNGAWKLGKLSLERMVCLGPVHIQLASCDGLRAYGPFAQLVIDQNCVRTDAGPFARYHPDEGVWHVLKEQP